MRAFREVGKLLLEADDPGSSTFFKVQTLKHHYFDLVSGLDIQDNFDTSTCTSLDFSEIFCDFEKSVAIGLSWDILA